MKRFIPYLPTLFLLLISSACEKEGDLITVSDFEAGQLTINNNTIVLNAGNQESAVLAFAWTESDLMLSNPSMKAPSSLPLVSLEAAASEDFGTFSTIAPSNNPHVMSGLALNTLALNLGLEAGKSSALYFRANMALGKNTEAHYSNVLSVMVTPFETDMSKGFIVNAGGEESGYLYAPDSDGIYSGFMNASAWANWFLKEGDGTLWGNVGEDGNEFRLSKETASHWNLWFPGIGGCYYTTVNTQTAEWTATLIEGLTASGNVTGEFTYLKAETAWLLTFTTETAGATFTVGSNTKTYNVSTSTNDEAAVAGEINFSPATTDGILNYQLNESGSSFTVNEAGTYTLTLHLADPANLQYTLEQGEVVIEDPISDKLYLPGIDDLIRGGWTFDTYLRLQSDLDSTFAGIVNVDSEWGYVMMLEAENWGSEYKQGETAGTLMSPPSEAGNIAAPEAGLWLIEADLKNLSYQYMEITEVGYSGINDDWTSISPLTAGETQGVFTAEVSISAPSEWGFKILLNNDWDLFFGANEGGLLYKDANINYNLENGNYLLKVDFNTHNLTFEAL